MVFFDLFKQQNNQYLAGFPQISLVPKEGYIKATKDSVEDMLPSARKRIDNSEKLFIELLTLSAKYVYVEQSFYNQMKTDYQNTKKLFALQDKTAELNNKGIKYEKEGNEKKAIETYEQNVDLGGLATHAYNRLCIIYRKQKDYQNEIRIINLFLKNFSTDKRYQKEIDKYKSRLTKATELLTKSYKQ